MESSKKSVKYSTKEKMSILAEAEKNDDYQVTGVIGEDDINGFTSFTRNYSLNYGVTGSIMNEITQEFY